MGTGLSESFDFCCACQGLGLRAIGLGDVAQSLGAYSLDNLAKWDFHEGIEREPPALALSQHPDVRSDGGKVTNEVAHIDAEDRCRFLYNLSSVLRFGR